MASSAYDEAALHPHARVPRHRALITERAMRARAEVDRLHRLTRRGRVAENRGVRAGERARSMHGPADLDHGIEEEPAMGAVAVAIDEADRDGRALPDLDRWIVESGCAERHVPAVRRVGDDRDPR